MKLIYIANVRLPTEKAHGLQIMQNCEAFAQAGAVVSLWSARRVNTTAMTAVSDSFRYYGVDPIFTLTRLPCIDLLPLVPGRSDLLARFIFALQLFTFTIAAVIGALVTSAEVYYSRDPFVLLALALIKPPHLLCYEAHTLADGRLGRWMQRLVARRVGLVIAVTRGLGDDLLRLGASPDRIQIAPDGIRRMRFENLPDRQTARRELGWDMDAFVVGYVGRLQTMEMDKGVGALVEAAASLGDVCIAVIGGPDDQANALRAHWSSLNQDLERFLYAGQVVPDRVPLYLIAMDVCVLPLPWTRHFAHYASPIKLFEYMAAGRAIIASDLPSTAEIVQHGETALLYPPGDQAALVAALKILREDPAARERLGTAARSRALAAYTWDARARAILTQISRAR